MFYLSWHHVRKDIKDVVSYYKAVRSVERVVHYLWSNMPNEIGKLIDRPTNLFHSAYAIYNENTRTCIDKYKTAGKMWRRTGK